MKRWLNIGILALAAHSVGQGVVLTVDQTYVVSAYVFGTGGSDTLKGAPFTVDADAPIRMFEPRPFGGPEIAIGNGDTLVTPAAAVADTGCYPGSPSAWLCPEGVRAIWISSYDSITNGYLRIQPTNGGASSTVGPITYYVPRLQLLDSAGTPWSGTIDLQTGSPVKILARILDYEGNVFHGYDGSKIALVPDAGSEALVFRTNWNQADQDSLIIHNGEAVFFVGAESPVIGGGFQASGSPHPQTGVARMVADFPVSLEIRYPDVATLDSAAVFDRNGDGRGDSIAGWFDRDLEGAVPESLATTWPGTTGYSALAGGSVVGTQVSVGVAESSGGSDSSVLRAVVKSASGRLVPSEAVLDNRIGPVIWGVTLLEGNGDDPDTLVALFNKDIDTGFSGGNVFLLNGEELHVDVAASGDRQWKFTVADGMVEIGDSLRLVPGGALTSADGNAAAPNNRPAVVMPSGRIPPVAEDGSGFWDRDADGAMDSVTVCFQSTLSQGLVDSLDLRFIWMSPQGKPFELAPSPSSLEMQGKCVGWTVNEPVQGPLTEIADPSYGYAVHVGSFLLNGETVADTVFIPMHDYMAPVIVSAYLWPESSRKSRGDSLLVTFSEPIGRGNLSNLDFLQFLLAATDIESFDTESFRWSEDGRSLGVRIAAGLDLSERANPGDSIRCAPVSGGVSDTLGNGVDRMPLWVLLDGNPRILVTYPTLAIVDRSASKDEDSSIDPEFLSASADVSDLAEGTLGTLLDLGFSPRPDSSGESDLHNVGFTWSIRYFTNLGGYVANGSGTIRCDDGRFSAGANAGDGTGNCFENPHKIYLRWNLRSENGRKVGTGAYVVQLKVVVWGSSESRTLEDMYTLGVRAVERN